MGRKKTTTEKEINFKFERLSNTFERGGWAVFALFLLTSILGIFGSGPLSNERYTTGQMSVQFNRFLHNLTPTELTVFVHASQGNIKISKEYLANYTIDAIRPQPTSVVDEGDDRVYRFEGKNPTVTFQMTPANAGRVSGEIATGKEKIMIQQFIYP